MLRPTTVVSPSLEYEKEVVKDLKSLAVKLQGFLAEEEEGGVWRSITTEQVAKDVTLSKDDLTTELLIWPTAVALPDSLKCNVIVHFSRQHAGTSVRSPSDVAQELASAVWSSKFEKIHGQGSPRWTAGQKDRDYVSQFENIAAVVTDADLSKLAVLVPFAGDHPLVHFMSARVSAITAVEWSAVAVAKLKGFFNNELPSNVRIFQEEWFGWVARAEKNAFDLVVDKDCYGFLAHGRRRSYIDGILQLTRPGAFVYLEVKEKEDTDATKGPPFHISRAEVESGWAPFKIVREFGKQPFTYGKAVQMAYMLRRE